MGSIWEYEWYTIIAIPEIWLIYYNDKLHMYITIVYKEYFDYALILYFRVFYVGAHAIIPTHS